MSQGGNALSGCGRSSSSPTDISYRQVAICKGYETPAGPITAAANEGFAVFKIESVDNKKFGSKFLFNAGASLCGSADRGEGIIFIRHVVVGRSKIAKNCRSGSGCRKATKFQRRSRCPGQCGPARRPTKSRGVGISGREPNSLLGIKFGAKIPCRIA
jgi:hypothetical protein